MDGKGQCREKGREGEREGECQGSKIERSHHHELSTTSTHAYFILFSNPDPLSVCLYSTEIYNEYVILLLGSGICIIIFHYNVPKQIPYK